MKDYKGKKFGRLTVMEFDKRTRNISKNGKTYYSYYWKCKCDCGNEVSVLLANLLKGSTKSCGCLERQLREQRNKERFERNFRDLTEKKFGKLTAIKMKKKLDSQGQLREYWLCKCDCGKNKIVLKEHLIKNKVISCGCAVKERAKQNIKKCEKYRNENINKERTRIDYLSNKVTKQNTTGVRGVSYNKRKNKYRAYIYFKNECIWLGEFKELEDAAKARANAEERYYKPILEKYNCIDKKNKEDEEELE